MVISCVEWVCFCFPGDIDHCSSVKAGRSVKAHGLLIIKSFGSRAVPIKQLLLCSVLNVIGVVLSNVLRVDLLFRIWPVFWEIVQLVY